MHMKKVGEKNNGSFRIRRGIEGREEFYGSIILPVDRGLNAVGIRSQTVGVMGYRNKQ